jgi:hypothetical protein
MDTYMAEKPEEFLEYSDWVTLDRFRSLLAKQARILYS